MRNTSNYIATLTEVWPIIDHSNKITDQKTVECS